MTVFLKKYHITAVTCCKIHSFQNNAKSPAQNFGENLCSCLESGKYTKISSRLVRSWPVCHDNRKHFAIMTLTHENLAKTLLRSWYLTENFLQVWFFWWNLTSSSPQKYSGLTYHSQKGKLLILLFPLNYLPRMCKIQRRSASLLDSLALNPTP